MIIIVDGSILKVKGTFTGTFLMKCRQYEQSEIDKERANLETRPRYILGKVGRAAVHFQFNLDIKDNEKTLFSILSNQTRRLVYLGSYKHSLFLEIDAHLSTKDGYDNLEFRLLKLEQRHICDWANESDYPYWKANAKIKIDFLDEGIFDKDGLFKQFEVDIH